MQPLTPTLQPRSWLTEEGLLPGEPEETLKLQAGIALARQLLAGFPAILARAQLLPIGEQVIAPLLFIAAARVHISAAASRVQEAKSSPDLHACASFGDLHSTVPMQHGFVT